LKLPVAGWRHSALSEQGTYGVYWSSMAHASAISNARYLYFGSPIMSPGRTGNRWVGFSIRCFKD
jgi:hypothetical protein